MNRRQFLKVTGTVILLSSTTFAAQDHKWINVDTKRPPLNADIAVLKFTTLDERKVTHIYVGKLVKQASETCVYIIPKISQITIENYDGRENYYRIEKNVDCDEKIEQFITKYYAKGVCKQNDYYWWLKEEEIAKWKEVTTVKIGFHMINTDKLRTYWTYADQIPKALP